jgi:hypothetical protein
MGESDGGTGWGNRMKKPDEKTGWTVNPKTINKPIKNPKRK